MHRPEPVQRERTRLSRSTTSPNNRFLEDIQNLQKSSPRYEDIDILAMRLRGEHTPHRSSRQGVVAFTAIEEEPGNASDEEDQNFASSTAPRQPDSFHVQRHSADNISHSFNREMQRSISAKGYFDRDLDYSAVSSYFTYSFSVLIGIIN